MPELRTSNVISLQPFRLFRLAKDRPEIQARLCWGLLLGLSVWLLAAAALRERNDWPSFMGDEATYLMQAESLAFDLDLEYSAADYHRFLRHWELPPQGLILQSGDGGETIVYGKPFFYGLYVAPFVRLSPTRGPFVANALLLALTAIFVARRLERRLGATAPLWVAALVFGSVSFAFTFWAHADLFLMCLTALALALAFGPEADPRRSETKAGAPSLSGLAVAGALLAVVGFSRPLYLPLFLPAILAIPKPRSRRWAALLVAALATGAGTASIHHHLAGSWTGYGAQRSGFYAHTGYPAVDFPAEQWNQNVSSLGNAAARTPLQILREKPLSPSLLAWNSWYFLAGRHVGLIAYFLPILLVLGDPPRDRARLALWLAIGLSVGAFLWTRPFNFYGGGGTIGNRYFLPLFPALWFLPVRPLRWRGLLVVVFAAGLFMVRIWSAPWAFPISPAGDYRYVSPVAQSLLPFETSQSHLKLAGREDLYNGFYLRLAGTGLANGRDSILRLDSGATGTFFFGRAAPIEALDLTLRFPLYAQPVVAGGARLEPLPAGAESRRWRIHLDDGPVARHPMWWSPERVFLYRLRLHFLAVGGERIAFELCLPDSNDPRDTENP